jgi:hypothetical protein
MSSARAGLLASLVLCACFSDPPMTGSDGESSTAAGTSSSSSVAESSTGGSNSSAEVGTDPLTSAETMADGSSSVSDGSAESSSGGDACACDGNEIICESFEPPFMVDTPPWGLVSGAGSVAPELVDDPVLCGTQALRASVAIDDLYSVLNASIGSEIAQPGVHRLAASLWVSSTCADLTTRVMLVKFPMGGGIVYQFGVWLSADGIELHMQNHASQIAVEPAVVALTKEDWHEIELEFDVTSQPPHASVRVDGVTVVADFEGPGTLPSLVFESMQNINLGIYRDDVPFTEACAVIYDDVRLTTR